MSEIIEFKNEPENIRDFLAEALRNIDNLSNIILCYSIGEEGDMKYVFKGKRAEIRSQMLEMLMGEVINSVLNTSDDNKAPV